MYVTAPLRSLILSQNFGYTADTHCSLYSYKLEIKQSETINLSTLSKELFSKLTPILQRAVTFAQEKGAFSSTCAGTWFLTTQDCLSRCLCFDV